MQLIAESYDLLKRVLGLDNAEINLSLKNGMKAN